MGGPGNPNLGKHREKNCLLKKKRKAELGKRRRMSYVALSLSLSLSRSPRSYRYLNIGDMIEYQDQLAIIRKVQKGRNVQVEFVSKTSKSKDFLFLFFSGTTFTPDKVDKRYISKKDITVSFGKNHPVTLYMGYFFKHEECWYGEMSEVELKLHNSAL